MTTSTGHATPRRPTRFALRPSDLRSSVSWVTSTKTRSASTGGRRSGIRSHQSSTFQMSSACRRSTSRIHTSSLVQASFRPWLLPERRHCHRWHWCRLTVKLRKGSAPADPVAPPAVTPGAGARLQSWQRTRPSPRRVQRDGHDPSGQPESPESAHSADAGPDEDAGSEGDPAHVLGVLTVACPARVVRRGCAPDAVRVCVGIPAVQVGQGMNELIARPPNVACSRRASY